jgi:hypothetical protein
MTSKALNSTSRQSFGIVTTSSRAQVVQFLNSHSVSDSPSTPSYETSPLLNVLPSKVSDPGRRIIKTPVMHPNLVYTLKSILSPKISSELDNANTSRDSRCAQFDNSQLAAMQGSERENSLGLADNKGKAPPESRASRPSCDQSLKQVQSSPPACH